MSRIEWAPLWRITKAVADGRRCSTRTCLWSSNKSDASLQYLHCHDSEIDDDGDCPINPCHLSWRTSTMRSGILPARAAGAPSNETQSRLSRSRYTGTRKVDSFEEVVPPAGGGQGSADTRRPGDHPSHPRESGSLQALLWRFKDARVRP